MAGRASIVGAAATHIGKVREHNEDAHFFDADAGVFLVCDGMGGHAAGEVASALAIQVIRGNWASEDTQQLADRWLETGTPESKKQLLEVLRNGVRAAHNAIIEEAANDDAKTGMGTTIVGAINVGNELVFAQAGDSRAYLVRDAIAMQLTEDHTLLARLLAAGIDVDVSGEGSRFRSMLTNALGIGNECKVSTFVVPLADGDRFLFCSDGVSEYVKEAEVGEILSKQPSPARAAQKLIELALERGGGDNATAIVVRVLEAGETPQPAEQVKREDQVIAACPLWGTRVTPQQRLRALRIAIPRDHAAGTRLPANTLGDRVAWILLEGTLVIEGEILRPGAIVYPESLVADSQAPDRDGLAVARTDVRLLALRADDFREICDDDNELGEALLEGLAPLISKRRARTTVRVQRGERSDIDDSELGEALAAAQRRTDAVGESVAYTPDESVPYAAGDDGDEPEIEIEAGEPEPDVQHPFETMTPIAFPAFPPRAPTPPPIAPRPQTPPAGVSVGRGPMGRGPVVITRTATTTRPASAPERKTMPMRSGPRPTPSTIAEAVTDRVERDLDAQIEAAMTSRVESELDARFDEVFADHGPTPPPTLPAGTERERVPLILKPRAQTDPGLVKIPAPLTIPARRSDPAIAEPGSEEPAARRPRPPSEPEIETEIELEAEEPPDDASESDGPEMIVMSVEDTEGRVTETVTDTSSQTLTLTVTEDLDPTDPTDPSDPPDSSDSSDIDEPTDIRARPNHAPIADPAPRPKRLSEGWDD